MAVVVVVVVVVAVVVVVEMVVILAASVAELPAEAVVVSSRRPSEALALTAKVTRRLHTTHSAAAVKRV